MYGANLSKAKSSRSVDGRDWKRKADSYAVCPFLSAEKNVSQRDNISGMLTVHPDMIDTNKSGMYIALN